jgi:hypothetical protein
MRAFRRETVKVIVMVGIVCESRKNTSPYPFGSKFCRLLACVVDEDEAHLEACHHRVMHSWRTVFDSVRRPAASGNDVPMATCENQRVRVMRWDHGRGPGPKSHRLTQVRLAAERAR